MLFITFYSLFINSPYSKIFAELNLILFIPMVLNLFRIAFIRLKNIFNKFLFGEKEIVSPSLNLSLPTMGEIESFIASVWLISPFIFAYVYYSYSGNLVDSLFESFSAITTTGLSVYGFDLPKDILLFRSFITWVGGIGFIGFSLMTLRGIVGRNLIRAFGIDENISNIGWRLFVSYVLITIISFLLCAYVGFNLFDSVNLALAGIGNGGFVPSDINWTFEKKMVINIVQLLGAISFTIYAAVIFDRNFSRFFRGDFKAFVLILLVLVYILVWKGYSYERAISLIVPAVSTGGFQEENLEIDDFSVYLIIVAMLVGGMQLSSAGGLKISKLYIATKGLLFFISRKFEKENIVKSLLINKKPVYIEDLFFIYAFLTSFVLLYLASVLFLLNEGLTIKEALFTSASAISNTGYSIVNISLLNDASKLWLTFIMYLGRIEILSFFILLYSIFNRVKR